MGFGLSFGRWLLLLLLAFWLRLILLFGERTHIFKIVNTQFVSLFSVKIFVWVSGDGLAIWIFIFFFTWLWLRCWGFLFLLFLWLILITTILRWLFRILPCALPSHDHQSFLHFPHQILIYDWLELLFDHCAILLFPFIEALVCIVFREPRTRSHAGMVFGLVAYLQRVVDDTLLLPLQFHLHHLLTMFANFRHVDGFVHFSDLTQFLLVFLQRTRILLMLFGLYLLEQRFQGGSQLLAFFEGLRTLFCCFLEWLYFLFYHLLLFLSSLLL